jgi:hypothetical protein
MLTITHIMLGSTLLAIAFSFFYGGRLENSKANMFVLFLKSFGISLLVAFYGGFLLFPICENYHFCAPTLDTNVFHILLPVLLFPAYWVAILIGYTTKAKK